MYKIDYDTEDYEWLHNNKHLWNLKRALAKGFGEQLCCEIVPYRDRFNSEASGMYVVCAKNQYLMDKILDNTLKYDTDTRDDELNVASIDRNRQINVGHIYDSRYFAIKVDDYTPMFVKDQVFDWAKDLELVNVAYSRSGEVPPDVFRACDVRDMLKYENFICSNLDKLDKATLNIYKKGYESLRKSCREIENEVKNGNTYVDDKKRFHKSFEDAIKATGKKVPVEKLSTGFFGKKELSPQEVSLSTLLNKNMPTKMFIIDHDIVDKFREKMKEHPEVLYHIDEKIAVYDEGHVDTKSGYNPWQNTEEYYAMRTCYCYDIDRKVINKVLADIKYPTLGKTELSIEEFEKFTSSHDIHGIVIPNRYREEFMTFMEELDGYYAFDYGYKYMDSERIGDELVVLTDGNNIEKARECEYMLSKKMEFEHIAPPYVHKQQEFWDKYHISKDDDSISVQIKRAAIKKDKDLQKQYPSIAKAARKSKENMEK